jgi:hypothetical protein
VGRYGNESRVALATLVTGCLLMACDPGGDEIRSIVEKMDRAGIECSDLVVDHPEGVGAPGAPAATTVGHCRLEDAPEVGGLPLETRILIFDDEAHVESLPQPQVRPGTALVYGDTFEVYVVPTYMGADVADAIGGRLAGSG